MSQIIGNMAKALQRCSENSPIIIDGTGLLYNHYENFRTKNFVYGKITQIQVYW